MSSEVKIPAKSRVGRPGPRKNGGPSDKSKRGTQKGKPEISNGSVGGRNGPVDDENDEVCLICAEKIAVAAYTPCQHVTCHKCILRQRALYKKTACLICRTDNENVIISDTLDKEYNWFENLTIYDDQYSIYFSSESVKEQVFWLLELRCPYNECEEVFDKFKGLQDHIRQTHNKFYCLICYNNKKAFISELVVYTYKALQNHQISGDQKGFEGHPECKHCKGRRFYSEDELNVHIRDAHERCHICDNDNPKQADYYRNYDALFQHFRSDHYVCAIQSCLDKKFVVFREDLDLTAHMLKEHGGITGSNNRVIIGATGRQFQSELSTFQQPRNSARQNRSNGQDGAADTKLKKMRFEERAKHYVENNQAKLEEFKTLNSRFQSGELTARDLVNSYKRLFENQTSIELALLLKELRELLPESSPKFKELKTATAEYENDLDNFPVLGGSPSGSTSVSLHGWGNSPGSSRNSSQEAFPVLAKAKRAAPATRLVANQPIRYTTIAKTQKSAPVSVRSHQNDTSFRPTYLENGSNSQTGAAPSSSNSSSSDVNKFPRLEKRTTKKVIPRVNPIVIPPASQWGTQSQTTSPKPEEEYGMPIIDKRKKKKKQILFQQ